MIPPLILASSSPRRKELLLAAGLKKIRMIPATVAESFDASMGLYALVEATAEAKALEVAASHPEEIVLGADTLVWMDGCPLGKPRDGAEARLMLAALSDRTHEVATGVHIVQISRNIRVQFHEITRVKFRRLSDSAVGEYLSRVDVLDKAGAYALQEHGELIVESVEGCRSNVIGLPVERTLAALRHFKD
ncbi:MAG: Maf family protein [Chthoniobacterales bacterium]